MRSWLLGYDQENYLPTFWSDVISFTRFFDFPSFCNSHLTIMCHLFCLCLRVVVMTSGVRLKSLMLSEDSLSNFAFSECNSPSWSGNLEKIFETFTVSFHLNRRMSVPLKKSLKHLLYRFILNRRVILSVFPYDHLQRDILGSFAVLSTAATSQYFEGLSLGAVSNWFHLLDWTVCITRR